MTYLEKVYMRTIQTATSERGTQRGMDIWQWDQGVAMFGFVKAYEKTGDKRIIDFIKQWIDEKLDVMNFGYSINTTAPLLGVLKLLEIYPDNKKYIELCDSFAEWCIVKAPRADRGVFEHSCTENKYDNQVWADTLFMGCLFLLKYGMYKNNAIYINEAIRQFILHTKFLKDDNTGLIYHGYDCNDRMHKGVLWGRGNGWYAVASAELLTILSSDVVGYDTIYDNFKDHINAILKYQDADGGWHTVINRNDTYIESSVTAAFAYALNVAEANNLVEVVDVNAKNKSIEFMKKQIDDVGNVNGGSLGTCVMADYKKYDEIGVGYSYFTQGLAMMAMLFE